MVMPRSRSIGFESSTCASISRASRPPQSWMMRSASVDLPWSTWAMMEKLRMCCMRGGACRRLGKVNAAIIAYGTAPGPAGACDGRRRRARRRGSAGLACLARVTATNWVALPRRTSSITVWPGLHARQFAIERRRRCRPALRPTGQDHVARAAGRLGGGNARDRAIARPRPLSGRVAGARPASRSCADHAQRVAAAGRWRLPPGAGWASSRRRSGRRPARQHHVDARAACRRAGRSACAFEPGAMRADQRRQVAGRRRSAGR